MLRAWASGICAVGAAWDCYNRAGLSFRVCEFVGTELTVRRVAEKIFMLKANVAMALVMAVGVGPREFAQVHAGARHSASAAAKDVEPTGPVVVIDTAMGRITCKLYEKQAPVTSANFVALAEGSKDWKDPATDQVVHGKGFYDGSGLVGVSDGVMGGDRFGLLRGTAGAPFAAEKSGVGV